jgi:hypothetical protein
MWREQGPVAGPNPAVGTRNKTPIFVVGVFIRRVGAIQMAIYHPINSLSPDRTDRS